LAVKLSKSRRYLVRVREYETVHVEVGAEISHYDIGYDDQSWAQMSTGIRNRHIKTLQDLLNEEVDRLAREELEVIADWSEISPNLADDYLQSTAPMQRNQNAEKTDTHSTSSRRLRRGTPSPPSPRPLRPA
jgi:hypothetical protein